MINTKDGIIYASFQGNVIGNISSVSHQLPDRKIRKKFLKENNIDAPGIDE